MTSAVKNIVHDNGSPIDVDNVLDVAVSLGYMKYCSIFDCDIPACSATVKLDGQMYHRLDFQLHGRNVYQDDTNENYLFYKESEHAWIVSPDFETQTIMKTSSCPQQGGIFMETTIDLPPIPGIADWRACSSLCLDRATCNFWQYHNYKCVLIRVCKDGLKPCFSTSGWSD